MKGKRGERYMYVQQTPPPPQYEAWRQIFLSKIRQRNELETLRAPGVGVGGGGGGRERIFRSLILELLSSIILLYEGDRNFFGIL